MLQNLILYYKFCPPSVIGGLPDSFVTTFCSFFVTIFCFNKNGNNTYPLTLSFNKFMYLDKTSPGSSFLAYILLGFTFIFIFAFFFLSLPFSRFLFVFVRLLAVSVHRDRSAWVLQKTRQWLSRR